MHENGYRAFWLFAADYVHQIRIFRDGEAQFQLGGTVLENLRRRHVFVGLGGWEESSSRKF